MFKGFKVWSIIYIVILVIVGIAWGTIAKAILEAFAQMASQMPEFPQETFNLIGTIVNSMAAAFFIDAVLVFLSFLLVCILGGKGKVNKGVLVPALLVGIELTLVFLLGLPLLIITIAAMKRTSRQNPAPARAPARSSGGSTPSPRRRPNDGFGEDDPIPADYGLEEETPRRRHSGDEFGEDEPIPADYGMEEETPRRRSGDEFGDDEPIPADYGLEEETPRRRGGEEFGDDDPIPADYGIVGEEEEETPRRRRPAGEEFGDDDPIPADYGLDD